MTIRVTWIKNTRDKWLPLETVDLSGVTTVGVYVIWHAGNPSKVVKVGQGKIADRVGGHKKDEAILRYRSKGRLYVTWASVPTHQMSGVERYLADRYSPLIGDRFPNVASIAVNLVGAA